VSATATALRASVRTRPVRRPARRRASLRVVDVQSRRRARRVRGMLWCFGVMIVSSLVAVVGFHVVLAQSQVQLDRLEQSVGEEQHRYEQLRFEVAALSSPARIVSRAAELGMVAPAGAATVVPVPTDPGAAPTTSDTTATTLAESWEKVKSSLA
jgi:cell division protein FtsL